MFVTMVEGAVEPEHEGDLRGAWSTRTAGELPPGLIESSLLQGDRGIWRIVTVWESRDAVMAMRASGRPAALLMFEAAGSNPSVSMWTLEGRVAAA
jgi:heme-degrading monooxygenase HmoA